MSKQSKKSYEQSLNRLKLQSLCYMYSRQMVNAIYNEDGIGCSYSLIDDGTKDIGKYCLSDKLEKYLFNTYKQFIGEYRALLNKTNAYNKNRHKISKKKVCGSINTMNEVIKILGILIRNKHDMSNMIKPNKKEHNRMLIHSMICRLEGIKKPRY